MKLTTEQLEKLAKMMPSRWDAYVMIDLGEISCLNFKFAPNGSDTELDNPILINWALDKLAECISVEVVGNEDGWRVTVFDVGYKPTQGIYVIGEGETKTFALVMALLEVCGG